MRNSRISGYAHAVNYLSTLRGSSYCYYTRIRLQTLETIGRSESLVDGSLPELPFLQQSIGSHGRREGLLWNPLGGRARSSLLHHLIDLLERETLGLWEEEVGVHESAGAETTPDEEDR
jgi:hypothetical protein